MRTQDEIAEIIALERRSEHVIAILAEEIEARDKALGICRELLEEVDRAERKHPIWPEHEVIAAAIVSEESGELIRAALQYKYEDGAIGNVEHEAIQTGAMAIRLLKNIRLKREELVTLKA